MSIWSFGSTGDLWGEYAKRYGNKDWYFVTTTTSTHSMPPSTSVLEGDKYTFDIELPGVKKDEVLLSVQDSKTLIVSVVAKKAEKYTGDSKYSIPFDFDPDSVIAAMEDGLLTVMVYRKVASGKKIEIR